MDQLQAFPRRLIKYRFWIVVGVAALMPVIAYFATAGSIRAETEQETGKVKAASSEIKQYQGGLLPNDEYKALVEQRTEALTEDIRKAWRLLYDQQAPLLTWPPEVSEDFTKWGCKWPVGVDDARIASIIGAYVQVYPQQVDRVYQSFRPFNFREGTGIVVAPAKEALLRPVTFSLAKPPTLGQVWGAQQKLWIQNTVLDVINRVNGDTRDWDTGPIKEITGLEVASEKAQDQRSIAKGDGLELAPEIVKLGTGAAVGSSTGSAMPPGGAETAMMMASYGSMGGAAATAKPEGSISSSPRARGGPTRSCPSSRLAPD